MRPGIEKKSLRAPGCDFVEHADVARAECFHDPRAHELLHHRVFETVELHTVELGHADDSSDLRRILVDEDAETQHMRGEIANNAAGLLRIQAARAFRENQTNRIDAEIGGVMRVFGSRHSAKFDPGPPLHHPSRMQDPSAA